MRQSFNCGIRTVILCFLGLSASACTTWVKPGATEYERQATGNPMRGLQPERCTTGHVPRDDLARP